MAALLLAAALALVAFARLWTQPSKAPLAPANAPAASTLVTIPGPHPPGRTTEPLPSGKGKVFGEVLDGLGGPVENATICAVATPIALPLPRSLCTRSDARGEYLLEIPASRWALGASAAEFAPSRFGRGRVSNRLQLGADESHRFDFILSEPGRMISGIVHDALGGTIAGALVTIGAYPGITEPGALVRTDEDGRFELTVPQRNLMISGYASGYFPSMTPAPLGVETLELILAPETLLRGRVVWDVDSRPAAAAEVFVRGSGSRGSADENGYFELAFDPQRGNTVIATTTSGLAMLELAAQVAGEHREVELRLQPGADLELALVIGDAREPCSGGFARFETPPADALGYLPVFDAPLEIRGLPLGSQTLRVGCGGTLERSGTLELVTGSQRVEWVLERAPVVRGRVVTAAGAPAGLVQLWITGERPSSDVTNVEGEFVADYLPPGIHEIEARAERLGQGGIARVDTRSGDVEIELRMTAWASVRGRVIDVRGQAIAGLRLSLAERPEPRYRGLATTSADGTFEFPAARSGALGLFAGGLKLAREGEPLEHDRIELVHDLTLTTELALVVESRERSLALRVIDDAGEPVAGLRVGLVRLADEGGLDYSAAAQTSDLDGELMFRELPEGELNVRWPDGSLERLSSDPHGLVWQPRR